MKRKNIFFAILLAIGLVSCSSCTKKTSLTEPVIVITPSCIGDNCSVTSAPSSVPIVTTPTTQVSIGDFWEVSYPIDWKKKDSTDPDVKAFYADSITNSMSLIAEEEFDGTFDEYVIATLRSLKSNDVTIVSSSVSFKNGNKVAFIVSENSDVKALMWIVVKSGKAFSLSCGTQIKTDDSADEVICRKIGESLKLR